MRSESSPGKGRGRGLGSPRPGRRNLGCGALEALVGAGSREDCVSVAEAERRPDLALLVPEPCDLGLEIGQLRAHLVTAAGTELLPELRAPLAEPFDVALHLNQLSHAASNGGALNDIPAGTLAAIAAPRGEGRRRLLTQIGIRQLAEDEYGDWLQRSRARYAEDMVANAGMDAVEAAKKAERDAATALPQGLATPGHHLLVLEDGAGARVGSMWFGVSGDPPRAWLYEIEIDEERRGEGLGRAAMVALEERVRELGCGLIELNVFGGNAVARSLYASLGYAERAVNMAKCLDGAGTGGAGPASAAAGSSAEHPGAPGSASAPG